MPRLARGFSLTELLAVVTVVGVLAAVAAPSFNDFLTRLRVRNAGGQLYGDLQYARSEAVQRNARVALTFDTAAWCYVVHTVVTGSSCSCTSSGSASCTGTASVLKSAGAADFPGVTLALSSGLSAFVFEPQRGGLDGGSTAGSATFSGSGSASVQAQVNGLGRTRLCLPSGSALTGHASC